MRRGPWLTPAFKAEVWRRWQSGERCAEIGQALDKTGGVIHGVVTAHTGSGGRGGRRSGAGLCTGRVCSAANLVEMTSFAASRDSRSWAG